MINCQALYLTPTWPILNHQLTWWKCFWTTGWSLSTCKEHREKHANSTQIDLLCPGFELVTFLLWAHSPDHYSMLQPPTPFTRTVSALVSEKTHFLPWCFPPLWLMSPPSLFPPVPSCTCQSGHVECVSRSMSWVKVIYQGFIVARSFE